MMMIMRMKNMDNMTPAITIKTLITLKITIIIMSNKVNNENTCSIKKEKKISHK